MKLTTKEKALARKLAITSNDVYRAGCNSCGTVYGLNNPYYLVEMTFSGYGKADIYRALLRALFEKMRG